MNEALRKSIVSTIGEGLARARVVSKILYQDAAGLAAVGLWKKDPDKSLSRIHSELNDMVKEGILAEATVWGGHTPKGLMVVRERQPDIARCIDDERKWSDERGVPSGS